MVFSPHEWAIDLKGSDPDHSRVQMSSAPGMMYDFESVLVWSNPNSVRGRKYTSWNETGSFGHHTMVVVFCNGISVIWCPVCLVGAVMPGNLCYRTNAGYDPN